MVSKGSSARQIALHWIAFVLVAFQWFAGDDMTRLFRVAHGGRRTRAPTASTLRARRSPATIRGADAGQRWMK